MPTLKIINNAKVLVYFNDHLLPHVHIKLRDKRECMVDLATFEINGLVPEREIRDVLAWIKANPDFLYDEWQRCNP